MHRILTLSLISLMTLSAFAENLKTIVYTPTPKMVCENCEKKIKSNLRFVKGTKRIDTSLQQQTITIVYDADKAKPEDYVKELAKLGRKVEVVSEDATQTSAKDKAQATAKDKKTAPKDKANK